MVALIIVLWNLKESLVWKAKKAMLSLKKTSKTLVLFTKIFLESGKVPVVWIFFLVPAGPSKSRQPKERIRKKKNNNKKTNKKQQTTTKTKKKKKKKNIIDQQKTSSIIDQLLLRPG